jgi:hypothetical protein
MNSKTNSNFVNVFGVLPPAVEELIEVFTEFNGTILHLHSRHIPYTPENKI